MRRNPAVDGSAVVCCDGHAIQHGRPTEVISAFTAIEFRQHRNRWVPRYNLPDVAAVLRATMLSLDAATLPAVLCTFEEAAAYGIDAVIEEVCGPGTFGMAQRLAQQPNFTDSTLAHLQRVLLQVQHRG